MSKYRQAREREAIFSARRALAAVRSAELFALRGSRAAAISGVIENV